MARGCPEAAPSLAVAFPFPGPHAGVYGLASTYLEQKKYDLAVKYYEQIVEANPNDKSARDGLKRARDGLGETAPRGAARDSRD